MLGKFRTRLRGETSGGAGMQFKSNGRAELAEARRKLAEKSQALKRLRQQVVKKDQKVEALQAELAAVRRVHPSSGLLDDDVQVFFLMGQARSGTTWLRGILNSHPEILCWGEGRLLERDFELEGLEHSQLANIVPNSLYGAIARSERLRAWVDRSVWSRGRETEEHLSNLTHLAIDYFLAEQLSKTDKRIVGDKTPFVSAKVFEEIGAVYPEAKVIHIIRDGRDVAVSMMHHMWSYARHEGGIYDLDPEELAKRDAYRKSSSPPLAEGLFTKERLRRLASGWRAEIARAIEDGPALLKDNYAEVRYEVILERPVEEVQRLLKFLGADADETTVERLVEGSRFERKSSRSRGQEDSSSRLRKGMAGDWRNTFTEEDRRIFKEVAGGLLIELGYEKDGSW